MERASDSLISDYERGDCIAALVSQYAVSRATIWRRLKKAGVTARPIGRARTYSLDETVFDTVNEASAYWIGFLMADGCVSWQGNSAHVALDASEDDAAHVLKYRDFLKSDQPVSVRRDGRHEGRKPMHRLSVCSRRLAGALAGFGVVPRKSHTAEAIGLQGDRHFWRGVVDGDGCVSLIANGDRMTPFLGLVGARGLLDQYAGFVRQSIGYEGRVRFGKGVHEFRLNGRFAVAMLHVLYDDCAVALDRKLSLARSVAARFDPVIAERAERESRRQTTCAAAGCGVAYYAKGFCQKHYLRARYEAKKAGA